MSKNTFQNSNLQFNKQNQKVTKISEIEETDQDALEVINQIDNNQNQPDILIGYNFEELTRLNLELEKELGLTMPPIVEGKAIRVLTETIPYWKSLHRILKESYLGKLISKESVGKIIEVFSKIPDIQKPKEIEKYQKILDEELAFNDILNAIIIRSQIREEILDSISDYPLEFQSEFIDLFIKGEVPDQNFYDRLKKAMEAKDIEYRDPRDIIENIKKEVKSGSPKYNQAYSPNQISELIEDETDNEEVEELKEFTYSDEIIQKQKQERQEMLTRLKKRQEFNTTKIEPELNLTALPEQNFQNRNQPPNSGKLNPSQNQPRIGQSYTQTYPNKNSNQYNISNINNIQNNQTLAKKDALIQSLIRKRSTDQQPINTQTNKHTTKNLSDLLGGNS